MLYLAIPAYNEVATIGVLLWRLRTVLAEFPREYEVVVYDDASTDETAAVAEQYERAMPVRVLRGTQHLGYAGATDALLRHIANATRYPRRDAVLLMQGDFTDPPVLVPEFARRFEGGADLVVGERTVVADAPVPVRRLFRAAHWAMRPFVRVDDVRDLTASMRLVRIAALRDALRVAGNAPFLSGDSWTANADLLLKLAPHARRVESVPLEPTYGVRMRDTRRVAMRDGLAALKWAWGARGRKAVLGSETDAADGDRRPERGNTRRREERKDDRRSDRRDEPELSVERLREKVREREGTRGLDGAPPPESRRERQRSRDREREAESRANERAPERGAERGAERSAERAAGERSSRRDRSSEQTTERTADRAPERSGRPERGESSSPRERPSRPERPDRARVRAEQSEGASDGAAENVREPRQARARHSEEQTSESRRPRREGVRDEPLRAALDDGLELDDPFAPPPQRRDRLEQVLDARTDRTRPRDPAPEVVVTPPDQPSNETPSLIDQALDRNDAPAHDDEPQDADAAEGSDDGGEDGAEAEGQPRKRRRNRRSRRGRRRRGDAEGSAEGTTESDAEGGADDLSSEGGREAVDDADDTPSDNPAPRRRQRPMEGAPVARRQQDAISEDGSAGSAIETPDDLADEVSDEFDEEASARPRRRGRRGRRGGARRSRGRRERGDGAAESDAPDGDD